MLELRDKNGLTEAEFLAAYTPGDYPHPSVTADFLVFVRTEQTLRLLLIRRGGHPCLGKWALPGGFCEPEETVEHAAKRELEEETHLTGLPLIPVGLFSDPGRDPRCWIITSAYMTLMEGELPPAKADDDAQAAEWFTVSAQKKGSQLEFTLTGSEVLHAELTVEEVVTPAGTQRTVTLNKQTGLAFDHGKIIGTALLKLNDNLSIL
jgi:ADP-ribose pyrophosphatase YjhB (NUDIX family)